MVSSTSLGKHSSSNIRDMIQDKQVKVTVTVASLYGFRMESRTRWHCDSVARQSTVGSRLNFNAKFYYSSGH